MPDPVVDPAAAPPATPPATPPADPPAPTPAAPVATTPVPDGPYDEERALRLIAQLRAEVKEDKADKRRAAELETELQTIRDAQLSEEQRTAQERDRLLAEQQTWQREKRDTTLKLAVYGQQTALGIADADLAIAALDHSQVEWSDDGQPTNLEGLLTDLLERKPLLKGAPVKPAPPTSDGGKGSGSQPPPALTAEEAEFATANGIPLERYAQMKQVKSIDDFTALKNP